MGSRAQSSRVLAQACIHGEGHIENLARRFVQLEARIGKTLAEHDDAIAAILSAIRELMHPLQPKRRLIGFTANLDEKS